MAQTQATRAPSFADRAGGDRQLHHGHDQAAARRLDSVMEDWCPTFPGPHAYYPSRRQNSRALALVIDVIRYKEGGAAAASTKIENARK